MDIGLAFSYAFRDPQWVKKALIAVVMLIIPIIGWLILYGYVLAIARRVTLGIEPSLPEWDDFGAFLSLGFRGAVVGVVWSIPALVISVCQSIVGALPTGRENDALSAVAVVAVCLGCLSLLVGAAINYLMPLPLTRLAATDRVASAFAFGEIFRELQRVPTDLLIVFVLSLVLGFLAIFGILLCIVGILLIVFGVSLVLRFLAILGILLCIVGILATLLYAFFVQGHLWGQLRRRLSAGDVSAAVAVT